MAKKNFFKRASLFGFPLLHPISIIFLSNAIIHLFQLIFATDRNSYFDTYLVYTFGLQAVSVVQGKIWQIFTYGFLHSTDGFLPLHFIFNMYAMYMTARFLVPVIGTLHFTMLYFISLIGAGIIVVSYSYGVFLYSGDVNVLQVSTIGASGALFGLLAILGIMYPNLEFYFFPIPIPIKAQYLVIISVVLGIVLTYIFHFPISNVGHIGGALCGYFYYSIFMQRISIPMPLEKFIQRKKQNDTEEIIDSQVSANKKILDKLSQIQDSEKESFLTPLQVPNANICPPNVFNTEDPFCLRCEWLVNCSLRKLKSKD
jgi:membrane associated rhomboid family serine protease